MVQIHHVYEKKGREASPAFLRKKKKGEELTKAGKGTRHHIPSVGTVTRGLLGPPLPPTGL
jgi:hypothetical protein